MHPSKRELHRLPELLGNRDRLLSGLRWPWEHPECGGPWSQRRTWNPDSETPKGHLGRGPLDGAVTPKAGSGGP